MTTIAYRGGVMAADRRCSAQDVHQCERTKVEKIGGWLVGVSGDLMHVACLRSLIAEKLEADTFVEGHLGKFEWADETYMSAIVVSPRHEIYFIENTKAGVVAAAKVGAPFVARGSGRDFALAAMRMGANAYEAVEIAAEFDCHTGDGVDTVELAPIAALSPAPSEGDAPEQEKLARLEDVRTAAKTLLANASGHYINAEDRYVLETALDMFDDPDWPEGYKPWPPQETLSHDAMIEYWWSEGETFRATADQTIISDPPRAYRIISAPSEEAGKGEDAAFDAQAAAIALGRDPRVDSTGFHNWRRDAKPAAEAKGEDEADEMDEPFEAGDEMDEDYDDLTDEQDAAIESATAEYQSTDGAEIVSGEPWPVFAPLDAFQEPETRAGETVTGDEPAPILRSLISSDTPVLVFTDGNSYAEVGGYLRRVVNDLQPADSEKIVSETRIGNGEAVYITAQDLAPLLPPERPQPATPEQLEATGVIDGEAGWWGRKLMKERA